MEPNFSPKGRRLRKFVLGAAINLLATSTLFLAATVGTQDAVANGDTRTLSFLHTHTRETATVTFRRNGQYDREALEQINWLVRDWRVDEKIEMDPRLFDILWEVYREVGSSQPINIVSAYRSPGTNQMLRARSKAVSEHSQHMLGKAMDIRLPDVDTARLRAVAMRMQYGGVGYYASSEFVHIDTGSVRAWPRMSLDQLARLFPNGKTLHLPASGKPLPGYEEAKLEIPARNAALAEQAAAGGGGSIVSKVASLFRKSAPEAVKSDEPVALAPRQVASALPDMGEVVMAFAPLPPRRPKTALMVASADPVPPANLTVRTASLQSPPPALAENVADLGHDEMAAARALFNPRSTAFLNPGFSDRANDKLSLTRFSGPAVQASQAPPQRIVNAQLGG